MTTPADWPAYGLVSPPASLADGVRACFWRDFSRLPPDTPRDTHIPASPYPGLVWITRGRAHLLASGSTGPCNLPMPELALSGAHRHPYHSEVQAGGDFFCLAFQPGALALLTGRHLNDLTDRVVDARDWLGGAASANEWLAWAHAVGAAPDHAQRIALCTAFLAPRWQSVCATHAPWLHMLRARWQRPARAVLANALGWSARHLQRRVLQMTGLRAGEVERMLRAEDALLAMRDHDASVVGAALDQGYADQAHFSREARAVFGLPPAALRELVQRPQADAHWVMRR